MRINGYTSKNNFLTILRFACIPIFKELTVTRLLTNQDLKV